MRGRGRGGDVSKAGVEFFSLGVNGTRMIRSGRRKQESVKEEKLQEGPTAKGFGGQEVSTSRTAPSTNPLISTFWVKKIMGGGHGAGLGEDHRSGKVGDWHEVGKDEGGGRDGDLNGRSVGVWPILEGHAIGHTPISLSVTLPVAPATLHPPST
ncbi:hypothetical protein BJ684DRAFT_18092 [Piptocephalis cylindrospora]|uniref:Uncharacterized protein n=1 Tax=Piptocephalis cylindrospora TaxID=1907219 RepID=A0A4P9XXX0_9FUNG|nr:hypothetical protein BJ684DRAFT_18092 [Piptocephalis cylindrospora]|eukprot:RKP11303.1 hypothetical protein BJ684DRAFT_18092 [Piptocephalis cylindrospora]